jgi:DNA-binding CsgD family transcriptional regulator/tetratricopeptide (TPR) repeat protein
LPLVGRRAELETLEQAWSEVEEGRRQVVFIGGEPGAGKTRLIAEVAGALVGADATVLVGSSGPDAGIPYQPFAEMLDHLFATAVAGSLAGVLGDDAGQLRRLSAQVVRHEPGLEEAPLGEGEARIELFDAVARLFRALADDRALALVLDDLHWAQRPTMALLEHVVAASPDVRLLVVAAFRTTAPDRSEEVAARVAELHRLEGVRRLDLGGLDTEAIAAYVSLRSGLPPDVVRAPAALLRDRTGGNPFFLRELWGDLERRGGVDALRLPSVVPASIGDTLEARVIGLGAEVRGLLELAAVLGDTFDLPSLVAASDTERERTLAFVDTAMAVGIIEAADDTGRRYSFVHALTRQAVLDRMAPSRRTQLHARAAQSLERQPPDPALVPRIAQHYLAAHILGFGDEALRYCGEAGRLANRSLAFEDAAAWFERAASLPECDPAVRAEMLLAAGAARVRATQFPQARAIYEQLDAVADPGVRLAAAVGLEDATWRPGVEGPRAADMLTTALDECGLGPDDLRYVQALGSLGRALAMAGETARARQVGGRAIELARRLGDDATLLHALTTSMWHGTTPDMAETQLARTGEVKRMAQEQRDYETLGSATNFTATVSYLLGRPDGLDEAVVDQAVAVQSTGQPYYRHVYNCLAHSHAFLRGDFAEAERWAEETLRDSSSFGDGMNEGPYGVQMFMIRRETGALEELRPLFDGREPFSGRWVPGLLGMYTELDMPAGMRRALDHLLRRDLATRTDGAAWPMELVFMVEGALALGDAEALRTLVPFLGAYGGMNLVSGTVIATFGSADRYLARVAAVFGDDEGAETHFATALAMDRQTRSVVHEAETLAQLTAFAASRSQGGRAGDLARQARQLAEPIGQRRVLRLLETLTPAVGPDGLTDRELEVLRLLAGGLSNHDIGERLHISANTVANHIRSILMKTGAANRTQAAMYAAQRQLV